ncbi:related to HECT [Lecanosticta acicola]|uniref:HECT-type E3 ubiquitin transferase n=1 Tax=Lecanosticta acicola TaxID=111012 RepID=A0AAI8Z8H7_9PEZI|nr:related to HECT [Lecanosticta acicola]
MGRIKKAATERHMATLSPFVKDFVKRATEVPLHRLPTLLDSFPQNWPLPRGDLYHWIPVLDRFDRILELFNKEYALNEGPQTQAFERRLLLKGDAEDSMPYPSGGGSVEVLDAAGYSSEGDRELVEAVLHFSRILLEHCGNRSLYSSSTHINDLLNTTSLSLLRRSLKLSLRLAQRYQVARYKNHHPSAQAVLLANHYNLNLDNLHKIAVPFPKPSISAPSLGQTPGKGKERGMSAVAFNPSDLVAIAKEQISPDIRSDLSNVALSYYEQSQSVARPGTAALQADASPTSPSLARRSSNLGPSRDRPAVGDRSASANDVSSTPLKSRESEETSTAPKVFQITADEVIESSATTLLKRALPNVPKDSQYELLNRVRIAKAFASPETPAQQLLEVRLLAIANLAYAYSESKFQEKIGIPDAEEPRRFHLAQQLCDLLQPATSGQTPLTLQSETTVLMTIEALTKSRHKVSEVADALAITVNHGALYYELRKVIASLHVDEHSNPKAELLESEWRDATFDLVNSLQQTNGGQARYYGEKMVAAGIMAILIEPLGLRTSRAERFHERVLQFFDSFVHNISTGFQSLANIKGLDVIADLTAYEVDAALENVRAGRGLPSDYKSKVVDYSIPFYQQSTLRQLFKNTVHMFEHNAGAHDRLLRNLIDTPQILGALRNVIENAPIFGSNVWSGAVNIVSSFIHNEPTSYQVIGEAGLSKSLLESITGEKVPDELPPLEEYVPSQETTSIEAAENGEPSYPAVSGILPVGEVLCDIPNAFGAICLNETGMQLFQASGALRRYFDVFLSPTHIRAMEEEGQTAATIGHSFDELSRHHPRLKDQIMAAVINMLKRLRELCAILAAKKHSGAKLWTTLDNKLVISGGQAALQGATQIGHDQAMSGADQAPPPSQSVMVEDDGTEDGRERATAAPYLSACFKFLDGFFHNASMCSLFCEESGAELLLDLAVSPSIPYDLVAFPLFNKSSQVLKSMCEAKAHLVLPSVIHRMQQALIPLKFLMENRSATTSFGNFINLSEHAVSALPDGVDGTTVVKSLVNVHLLSHVLGRILAPPAYSLRHHSPNNALFSSLNFTEVYMQLVDQLSQLHASCVWEGLLLMHDLPEARKMGTEPRPFVMRRVDANGVVEVAGDRNSETARGDDAPISNEGNSRESVLAQKNLRTIRYLLSQVPMGLESFLHSLGQAVATKRMDSMKEHGAAVSRRLAKALIWELDFRRDQISTESLETKYTASILALTGRVLLRNSYSMEAFGTKEALTSVLKDFYLAGGFSRLNEHLARFVEVLAKQQEAGEVEGHVKDGIHAILNFYSQVVRQKCVLESSQSQSGSIGNSRDKNAVDYFQPSQFLLELRDAILPAVSKIWHSGDIEKINDSDVRLVVDILRIVLKAEGEDKAFRRSDHATRRVVVDEPSLKLRSTDGLERLTGALGFDQALSEEAFHRCNGNLQFAEAYCRLRLKDFQVPRFPPPETSSNQQKATQVPLESAEVQHASDIEMIGAPNGEREPAGTEDDSDDNTAPHSDDSALLRTPQDSELPPNEGFVAATVQQTTPDKKSTIADGHSKQPYVTVDDLDEKRMAIRRDLIDRCLEVLSTQPSLTFELSDLIQAAVAKAGEGTNARVDIGQTLVSSLMSLYGEEPSKESGLKIHAYAHLIALIIQDRDFFDSILDELKDSFETLVSWVQLEQEQKIEDAPWIETILLIIERVLAEDEQPVEIQWEAPPPDDPLKPMPLPPRPDPIVSMELRSQLFEALLDMLPKIGKNKTLALSVSRALVVLTRTRDLALRLSDKPKMGRLFLMVRQLAGSIDEKVQSSLMLILRHIIEDDDTIRQVMRAEIRALFENQRSNRAMDTTSYIRSLHHLVLRNPQTFVEITQEMLEITRFDGEARRAQTLALKRETTPVHAQENSKVSSAAGAQSTDGDASKSMESRPPVGESSDGVIQFLLRELTNYRDVEDKPALPAKENQGDGNTEGSNADIEMPDATIGAVPEASSQGKAAFKPEDHAIYVYRCFILQCLAELLQCYNRTKIEFINFSRSKPEPQSSTPSKPRAGTLRYLLETLLPVGTLEHRDDVAHRKKVATSTWANAVLVALCTKTQERHWLNLHTFDAVKFAEQEPELTFVRKFVLEHALKSFNAAMSGPSSLDERYSRLLALGELFNRILNDKVDLHRSSVVAAGAYAAQQQIGRLMYERGFIGTLTSAIADLDLNFPNAKRTVKYILNPLKQLTELGVHISQSSDSSTEPGGSTEEEEISSATSEDEDEDEREQTPDMYRGSSLGIFETAGNDDDESESESEDEDEDEEMYEETYDEDMDYDEEPAAEHGDVVSDEDDDEMDDMGEIEGVPGDIEMQLDIVDDDDDDEDEDGDDMSEDDDDEDDDSGADAEFADQMDEITGDDDNASMGEHDEGDWEDDFNEHGIPHDGGSPHGGPLDHIAHVLGAEDPSESGDQDGVVRIDMGGEEEFFEDEMLPEDDEDEDEIDYGEDMIYEPEMEDDEDEEEDGGWAWNAHPVGVGAPAILRGGHVHHHHHHHHRAFPEMFSMMAGEGIRPTGAPFRSHRATPNTRDEDGINPLLQRDGGAANAQRERDSIEVSARQGPRRAFLPRHGDAILQDIVAAVGPPGSGGVVNINVDPAAMPGLSALPPMFAVQQGQGGAHAMIDLDPRRPWREQLSMGRWPDILPGGRLNERTSNNHGEAQAVEFRAATTSNRWQEEARMLFPGSKAHEKATRVVNMLLRALVPAAMEAKRIREKEEAERRAAEEKAAEQARQKAEAEKAEREAQEKKEREEREAKEREEAEARAMEEAEQAAAQSAQADSNTRAHSGMEGVQHDGQPSSSEEEPATEAPQGETVAGERVTISIRGRELDITSLGIDREYIEALPEDMREEVIMAQFAEQRSQQVESGEGPSEISREFLEALPREIQQELLRSEQMERRRREREETRRRATQEGAAAQPEEMNNADFMAMLDPNLRRAILMDADDSVLSALPEEVQAEARALFGDRRPRGDAAARVGRGLETAGARAGPRILNGQLGARHGSNADYEAREVSRQRRPVAQMLDKAGVATLLRLMFVSLNHKAKNNLHGILSDVCKNTQNRAEVISILLAILQDGTSDVNAVERSFAQLSLRAKTPPSTTPRTPQPPKRALAAPSTELSPLNIVQQCLGTLNALSNDNQRVNSFFLSEHETSISQKAKSGKKGKGPESKAVKFPLNALLTLLDRKLITENTSVMETLASLLSTVTRPLTMLLRRAKEAQGDIEKENSDKGLTVDEQPQTNAPDVPMEEAGSIAEQPPAAAESSGNATDAVSGEAAGEDKATRDVGDKKKHHRDLVPPEVPDENIRLVVNILAARECPSKTFSDTLDIIKNMSAIPGAKEVFGKELIRQAQELGQALLEDLDDLAKHISAAQTGTDVQGMALASFSSAGAKQRRLLRVLVALDHLFDPKRMPQAQVSDPKASGSDIDQQLKEEILATLYESTTFDKLWHSLSTCLTAIRQRGNMVNVATILLPLIESLMVVCRNSTLKDTAAESAGTPPPPEARMETLFFNFTEEHRKILNELVRNNPKLMNGNLSVMAKNSKVLEFDNKRNYFSRQLHDRRAEVRVPHPSLQLSVRRDNVFLDSFKSLYFKTPDEIKYGKLNIRFHGEEGIDAGGVSREWFAAMARQMFNPDYALFNPVASDRTTFHPNSLSQVNPEHLMFFKFIGRIIGKALYENRVLDCHFSRAVYRKILGKSVSLKDMETLDLDYYKSLVWMLENDITDVAFETFSFEVDKFGVTETIDLMPGGRDIAVTEDNKHEYVRLVVEYKLIKSVQEQLDHFLEGFHEIIPSHLISIFNEQELELLISGLPEIDVDDWKNNTEYHNYQPTSAQIQWFWRAVRSFDKEEKAKLLQFVTGTSKVPLNGFKELEGMNGHAKFNIHRDYSSKEKLPSSHTCFNQLDLPEYESYEHLRQQMYTAITAGSEYFGFA